MPGRSFKELMDDDDSDENYSDFEVTPPVSQTPTPSGPQIALSTPRGHTQLLSPVAASAPFALEGAPGARGEHRGREAASPRSNSASSRSPSQGLRDAQKHMKGLTDDVVRRRSASPPALASMRDASGFPGRGGGALMMDSGGGRRRSASPAALGVEPSGMGPARGHMEPGRGLSPVSRSRSGSPAPPSDAHAMTSVGPGLAGSRPESATKPSSHSLTSIGRGLSPVGRSRSGSPAPLSDAHAMTSVGPGLAGSRPGSATKPTSHSLTSIGPAVPGVADRHSASQQRPRSPSLNARPLAGASPLDDPERLARAVASSSTSKAMSGLPGHQAPPDLLQMPADSDGGSRSGRRRSREPEEPVPSQGRSRSPSWLGDPRGHGLESKPLSGASHLMTSIGPGVPSVTDRHSPSPRRSASPLVARPLAGASPLDDPERLARAVAGSSTNKAMNGLPGHQARPQPLPIPAADDDMSSRSRGRSKEPLASTIATQEPERSPAALQDQRGRGMHDGRRSQSPVPLGSGFGHGSATTIGPGARDLSHDPMRPRHELSNPHAPTSIGPGLSGLPTEAKRRSQSPGPLGSLGDLHSSTSVGPGLSALSPAAKRRSQSPVPLDVAHSSTSVGPGLGALPAEARKRSQSPLPLRDVHSSTSVGPGLGALPVEARKRSLSPSPLGDPPGPSRSSVSVDDPSGSHSSTSVGPGLAGLRARSPAPLDSVDASTPAAAKDKTKKKKHKGEAKDDGLNQSWSSTSVGPGLAGLAPPMSHHDREHEAKGKKGKKEQRSKKERGQSRLHAGEAESPASSRAPAPRVSPSGSCASFDHSRLLHDSDDDGRSSRGSCMDHGLDDPLACVSRMETSPFKENSDRRKHEKGKKNHKEKRDRDSSSVVPSPTSSRRGSIDELAADSGADTFEETPKASKKDKKDKKAKKDKKHKNESRESIEETTAPSASASPTGGISKAPAGRPASAGRVREEVTDGRRPAAEITGSEGSDVGDDFRPRRVSLHKAPSLPLPSPQTPVCARADGAVRRLRRLLVRFDPPTLALEWEERRRKAAARADVVEIAIANADLVSESSRSSLAKRIAQEHGDLLPATSAAAAQVGELLRLMWTRVLPAYRVASTTGVSLVNDGPTRITRPSSAPTGGRRPESGGRSRRSLGTIPDGALVLVKERVQQTGPDRRWWLKLATGGWVEEASMERCAAADPEELKAWSRKVRAIGGGVAGSRVRQKGREARAETVSHTRRQVCALT